MSTWNMPPGVSTTDIPGNELDDCSTCGSGPCPTPDACLRATEATRRSLAVTRGDILAFWGVTGSAVIGLIALALWLLR